MSPKPLLSILLAILFLTPISTHSQTAKLQLRLQTAITMGMTAEVEKLIDQGADINAANEYGKTPLIQAVESKNLKLTKLLLAKGADPNKRDPLVAAIKESQNEIAELLINKGADVTSSDWMTAWTPLHEAMFSSNESVIKLLLSKGADPNA